MHSGRSAQCPNLKIFCHWWKIATEKPGKPVVLFHAIGSEWTGTSESFFGLDIPRCSFRVRRKLHICKKEGSFFGTKVSSTVAKYWRNGRQPLKRFLWDIISDSHLHVFLLFLYYINKRCFSVVFLNIYPQIILIKKYPFHNLSQSNCFPSSFLGQI